MVSIIRILDSLTSFGSKITPNFLKKWIFSFFLKTGLILKRTMSISRQIFLKIYLVEGKSKVTGERISLVYYSNFGQDIFPAFLANKLFSSNPTIKKIGRKPIFLLSKQVYFDSVDAIMVCCDRFFHRFVHKSGFFVFPYMVDMVLDTSVSLKYLVERNHISQSAYSDIRNIKKYHYSFEITTEIEKIKMFYYSMYQPMIYNRHEDSLLYTPPFVFFKYLREIGYKLLLVKDNKFPISGVFFHESADELFVRYAGVYDGRFDLIQKGASAAHYYYSLLYAHQRGIDQLNVGAARPFFDDGVFRYKRKWGMKVIRADGFLNPEICGIFPSKDSQAIKKFLIESPVIGLTNDNEQAGYFFFLKTDEITKRKKEEILEKNKTPGLEDYKFVSVDNFFLKKDY